ncbi:MAG: hypothetical protein FJ146_12285 [Deltaproteobacteria bacterium]|nr:hypothetical protein [Deltaproteobacteria bacterium]
MIQLLSDTCSVIKLLAPGLDLFRPGLLTVGDLVVHPLLHQEVKKWCKEKKQRLKVEIDRIKAMRAPPGIRLDKLALDAQCAIIRLVEVHLDLDIGHKDREYLATVLCNDQMELVTNDVASLGAVAKELDVNIRCAEEILVIAHREGVVSKKLMNATISHWLAIREIPSRKGRAILAMAGFRI